MTNVLKLSIINDECVHFNSIGMYAALYTRIVKTKEIIQKIYYNYIYFAQVVHVSVSYKSLVATWTNHRTLASLLPGIGAAAVAQLPQLLRWRRHKYNRQRKSSAGRTN